MNSTDIAAYCAASANLKDCLGICPDPGIAGIGTRVASYVQAILSGEHVPQIKQSVVIPL